MPDRSLLLLLDEVRGKTLRLLQGVTEEEARWAPPGLHNHILWQAGHCFVLVECLTSEAVGGQPQLPETWFEMFGWESEPARVPPSRWPPLSRVVRELDQQHQRLHRTLSVSTDDLLTAPSPATPNRTVRYAILHALHDEACHGGEIWLLRKLLPMQK